MWGVIGYEVIDPGVSPPPNRGYIHNCIHSVSIESVSITCEPVHPKVPKSAYQTKQRGGCYYRWVQMKNPPSLTGLIKVGVIGFELTTPCSQSRCNSVYLPMGSSSFEGLTIPFLLYHRSFLPFLSTFSVVAHVGKSSCNRLMGMLQYRSVVAICL